MSDQVKRVDPSISNHRNCLQSVMADNQRIHPMAGDVEAPPPATAPLVPPGSSNSEKGPPLFQHPLSQRAVAQRNVPVIHSISAAPKRRSCCKCMCWTFSFLILLLIAIGATAGILYLVFQPKLPNYSVDSMRISDLRLNFDMTLYAKFNVKITAKNPNKKIGIYYEKGGLLSVLYTNTKLCEGALPIFYQGHQNKTVLSVSLTGQTPAATTIMTALQQQQQTGRIPLELYVDAPVAIKLGRLKMKKVRVLGDCSLVVDSLNANNLISIKASNCNYKLKL